MARPKIQMVPRPPPLEVQPVMPLRVLLVGVGASMVVGGAIAYLLHLVTR